MSTLWFRELGFHNNPFSIKPAAFHDKLVGNEEVVDEISYAILNNKIILLDADYGEGKSSILKRLLHDFGGKKQVIYYSCNRIEKRINIKKLLNGKYGIVGKWFDMKPKDMILLLDEAQDLTKKDYDKIHSYFEGGYFKAVVLVGKGFDKKEMPDNIKNAIKEVNLKSLTGEQVYEIIKKRTGELPFLTKEIVKKLYDISDNNVRKMLKDCEEVCKYAVTFGEDKLNDDVIKEALELDEIKETTVKKKVIETVKKKVEETKKKIEEKKTVKETSKKAEKETSKKASKEKVRVYNQEEKIYDGSAEDMLSKGTDELFSDEQYL